MSLTKNIFFRSYSAVVRIEDYEEKENSLLKVTVTDKQTKKVVLNSEAPFPYVMIPRERESDVWDLINENIVSVGTTRETKFIRCRLLHVLQRELRA